MFNRKKYLIAILRNSICVILALIVTYLLSIFIGNFIGRVECSLLGYCSSGFADIDLGPIAGLVIGYFLFVPLLLISFGGIGKYWWAIIIIIPSVLVALFLGFRMPELTELAIVTASGFLTGFFVDKILRKFGGLT